jgi:hypothetical protein
MALKALPQWIGSHNGQRALVALVALVLAA